MEVTQYTLVKLSFGEAPDQSRTSLIHIGAMEYGLDETMNQINILLVHAMAGFLFVQFAGYHHRDAETEIYFLQFVEHPQFHDT